MSLSIHDDYRDYYQCVIELGNHVICERVYSSYTPLPNSTLMSFHKQIPNFIKKIKIFNAIKPNTITLVEPYYPKHLSPKNTR